MTDVEPVRTTRLAGPAIRKLSQAGSGFVLHEEDTRADRAPFLGGLTTVGDVPPMPDVAIETPGDEPIQRQVGAMLSELTALQRAMLGLGDPASVLRRLEEMADVMPHGCSPRLVSLLAAIRLRARVELVRR